MTDIRMLEPAAAAAALSEAGAAARGFLGLDPVVQNEALLARELGRREAQVLHSGAGLLGFAPNPAQPHQAYVASTSADPEPLRAFLAYLTSYRRCTSYVAQVPEGAPGAAAFESCGFERVGTLRAHRFAAGAYRDVHVYYCEGEGSCRS